MTPIIINLIATLSICNSEHNDTQHNKLNCDDIEHMQYAPVSIMTASIININTTISICNSKPNDTQYN